MTPTPTPTVDLDLDRLESAARAAEDDSPSPYVYDRNESDLRDATGSWLASFDHNTQGEFYSAFNPATALSLISALRASEAERERLNKAVLAEAASAIRAEILAKEQAETIETLKVEISHFGDLQNECANMDVELDRLQTVMCWIAAHRNTHLTDGSKATRACLDAIVSHAETAIRTRPSGGDADGGLG